MKKVLPTTEKKHKTKIFILELDNEQIWLHIPVVGGKVGSLIENLKEDFAQHEMEGEFSLPSDLTYDEIRESFLNRAIGHKDKRFAATIYLLIYLVINLGLNFNRFLRT